MTNVTLPGGLDASLFLARTWQRRAKLIRRAFPHFSGCLGIAELFRIATRDDVQSRIVSRTGKQWSLEQGPFRRRDLERRPRRDWTLLVQGLNHVVPAADALLHRFRFIPYARLDDVMVSYAVPGGGVGPHFDSYDVFLLQGPGRRRWRIGRQHDFSLRPGAPIKILSHFRPTTTAVLDAGDMLYLPPSFAHDGVALDACTTYSIGFRAPSNGELVEELFTYLGERLRQSPAGEHLYRDAGMPLQPFPSEIPPALVRHTLALVRGVQWRESEVADFLGEYLSRPKAHIAFDAPSPALGPTRFAAAICRHGVRLDARSILLCSGRRFYINGVGEPAPAAAAPPLRRLADDRVLLATRSLPQTALPVLHRWYLAGYLHIDHA